MEQRQVPTWKQLAELRGTVVTPEEAQRHYRRVAWRGIIVIWSITVFFLAMFLLLRFTLDAQ